MYLYLLGIALFCNTCYSQTASRRDSLSLFYNINETESILNNKRIDSLLSLIKDRATIKITGYADFLHSTDYNIHLSQKRADVVKEYIRLKSGQQITVIACKGIGEKFSHDNQTTTGEPLQRRVDIIVESYAPKNEKSNQPPVIEEKIIEKNETKKNNNFEDLEKGQSLAVEGLNFEPGRHYITKASVPVLQKVLKTLENNKKLKIQIQGHVCCTDGQDDGLDYDTRERKLSENRARAIYEYLISKGISASRLSYKGFGHSQPKFPAESTPEEEQANRRVEIMIISK